MEPKTLRFVRSCPLKKKCMMRHLAAFFDDKKQVHFTTVMNCLSFDAGKAWKDSIWVVAGLFLLHGAKKNEKKQKKLIAMLARSFTNAVAVSASKQF